MPCAAPLVPHYTYHTLSDAEWERVVDQFPNYRRVDLQYILKLGWDIDAASTVHYLIPNPHRLYEAGYIYENIYLENHEIDWYRKIGYYIRW